MKPESGKRYTEEDLQPIIEGKVPVPNLEPVTPEQALNLISYWGGEGGSRGNALVTDEHGRQVKPWARYYLEYGQGGGLTGKGLVVYYGDHKGGHAANFAICKHQKVEGPGANHSRGWHPGWCGLCGMNMDVDSGD